MVRRRQTAGSRFVGSACRVRQAMRAMSEPAADFTVALIGTWLCIFCLNSLFVWWAWDNTWGGGRWDPFPFIFMNLFMSWMASNSTPLILISGRRSERALMARLGRVEVALHRIEARQLRESNNVAAVAHPGPHEGVERSHGA